MKQLFNITDKVIQEHRTLKFLQIYDVELLINHLQYLQGKGVEKVEFSKDYTKNILVDLYQFREETEDEAKQRKENERIELKRRESIVEEFNNYYKIQDGKDIIILDVSDFDKPLKSIAINDLPTTYITLKHIRDCSYFAIIKDDEFSVLKTSNFTLNKGEVFYINQ